MAVDGAYDDSGFAAAPSRPRDCRWGVAAALPGLRRDRWRAGRAVLIMLGGDDVFRAALVRGVRVAISASDGRGSGLRRLCARAAELGPRLRGAAL